MVVKRESRERLKREWEKGRVFLERVCFARDTERWLRERERLYRRRRFESEVDGKPACNALLESKQRKSEFKSGTISTKTTSRSPTTKSTMAWALSYTYVYLTWSKWWGLQGCVHVLHWRWSQDQRTCSAWIVMPNQSSAGVIPSFTVQLKGSFQ